MPQWLKSRDEIIRDLMKAKDGKRYQNFEKIEKEAKELEKKRRSQMFTTMMVPGPDESPQVARVSNTPNLMRKMSGKYNKVKPEKGTGKKKSFV